MPATHTLEVRGAGFPADAKCPLGAFGAMFGKKRPGR